ncbi:MAG: hypothetical protein HC915_12340, partial [Anaerolineae bacterium]|nr:hypothetical protein [Anaerolineae bacterium]
MSQGIAGVLPAPPPDYSADFARLQAQVSELERRLLAEQHALRETNAAQQSTLQAQVQSLAAPSPSSTGHTAPFDRLETRLNDLEARLVAE